MSPPDMDDWRHGWDEASKRLSPQMRQTLRSLARGEPSNNSRSIAALTRRNLCSTDGSLTPLGRARGIGLLPLVEQCRLLNLELEVLTCAWSGRPEDEAASRLAPGAAWAFADEGRMVHALLHAIVLPTLRRVALDAWSDEARARSYLYNHYAGYQFFLEDEPNLPAMMRQAVLAFDADDFRESWRTLSRWNRGMFTEHPASSTSPEVALQVVRAIGLPTLAAVLRAEMEVPYAFFRGWPDLTLPTRNGTGVRFVEVKTTDRLHFSQIVTIPELRAAAGLDVSVVQLRRPIVSS